MAANEYSHIPVLLAEVMSYLQPGIGQNIVDATLGGGGYSRAILKEIGETGKLLSIDLDQDAIANFRSQIADLGSQSQISNLKSQIILVHGNFAHIDKIIKSHGFPGPDGIVADLGLSSYELDQGGRGISFQKDEPLDMRFDQASENETAAWILNNKTEAELSKIFNDYGEEKFTRQIVRKIFEARSRKQEIRKTSELYEIIKEALPKPVKHKAADSARRVFQALRIAVNHELENLEEFLPKAFDILAPGGRLVIVSFHSLEDRMVKQFFVGLTKGCICPIEFPECRCGKNPQGKLLTKKLVAASAAELETNPRSKPAKLRAIQKL